MERMNSSPLRTAVGGHPPRVAPSPPPPLLGGPAARCGFGEHSHVSQYTRHLRVLRRGDVPAGMLAGGKEEPHLWWPGVHTAFPWSVRRGALLGQASPNELFRAGGRPGGGPGGGPGSGPGGGGV